MNNIITSVKNQYNYGTNSYSRQNAIAQNVDTPSSDKTVSKPVYQNAPVGCELYSKYMPSFSAWGFSKGLSKQDKEKFDKVYSNLDIENQKNLNDLLKSGKLLDNTSNDKSTTLDNLYKIATSPRVSGLDTKVILSDVISTIRFPYNITQKFGDIPQEKIKEVMETEKSQGKNVTAADLDVTSSTCPAASIEFNLAHKMPAEFARMAEALTTDKMEVQKTINMNELSQGLTNTLWMLNEFGTEHSLSDWNTLNVTLKPDKNAITRAKIQNSFKDPEERSVIDVLMQSTFMNVAAQNSYDSITDKRIPKYNDDNTGLIDIEKNFVEELVTGKGKVCVTYQKLDDNGKLIGYECEQNETLTHIKDTLEQGDNVIIGYTYCDEDKNVIGGHEITIVGIEKDSNGKQYFVCNDTDDGLSEAIKYPVEELLPKIHHAGIPKNVLGSNVEFVEPWKELMEIYKENRQQNELRLTINQPNTKLTVLNQAA